MVGCFWIGRDEGSFRWNMEWVVGKREGRSVGELCPVEGEREMGRETKAIVGCICCIVLGNRPFFTPTIAHVGIHLCTGLIEMAYICD